MDLEKREDEIHELFSEEINGYIETKGNFIFDLVLQEREIIKQERKDAMTEFAVRLYRRVAQQALYLSLDDNKLFKNDINDLLKHYGIEEKI